MTTDSDSGMFVFILFGVCPNPVTLGNSSSFYDGTFMNLHGVPFQPVFRQEPEPTYENTQNLLATISNWQQVSSCWDRVFVFNQRFCQRNRNRSTGGQEWHSIGSCKAHEIQMNCCQFYLWVFSMKDVGILGNLLVASWLASLELPAGLVPIGSMVYLLIYMYLFKSTKRG